jgi:inner membrane protein
MLGVTDAWVLLALFASSVGVTLLANWAADWRRGVRANRSIAAWVASLVWIAVLFVAGVIVTRYIERISWPAMGYIVFGVVALLLSVMRALLFRSVQERPQKTSAPNGGVFARSAIHNGVYLLFAVSLYLLFHLFLGQSAHPVLIGLVCIGALLPDLDTRESIVGRLLPFLSRRLESRLGHRQEWHSIAGAAAMALAAVPLVLVAGVRAWYPIPLGFVSHLLVDLLQADGIMLLWPASRTRYSLFGGAVSQAPRWRLTLSAALVLVVVLLLLAVDLGPRSEPPVVAPSYEQTVERYYSLRGRYLVFASLEGTWQATGRSVSGSFEILNASGQSFTMLDRFTGAVFSAGCTADDNLYVRRITLQTGSAAQVKPVEIQLDQQLLADALPVLYEMQREPGLQYIYVSGEVKLAAGDPYEDRMLVEDHSQSSLRRVRLLGPDHYSLRYVTAGELIALANTAVERADLVVVATSTLPATGPTPTALPSPPPAHKVAP